MIDATGAWITSIVAVPVTPSWTAFAVMIARPIDTPMTTPDALTVATPGLELENETVLPASARPVASLTVTVSCRLFPTARDAFAGDTTTDATSGCTRRFVLEVAPSARAVMTVAPSALPVAIPLASIDTMFGSRLDQVTLRPVSFLPAASRSSTNPKS